MFQCENEIQQQKQNIIQQHQHKCQLVPKLFPEEHNQTDAKCIRNGQCDYLEVVALQQQSLDEPTDHDSQHVAVRLEEVTAVLVVGELEQVL